MRVGILTGGGDGPGPNAVLEEPWGGLSAPQSNRVVRVPPADAVQELDDVNPQLWDVAHRLFA